MFKTKFRIATEGGEIFSESYPRKFNGEHRKDKLFLCPKCRVVWEHVPDTGHRPAHEEYYPDCPRYGKPEKICPRCG